MEISRRPHQVLAVGDVLRGFKKEARGQLIMACGTGKTATGLWIKEDLDAQRTLVLIPSIALVDQFASEWRKFADPGQQYAALCVCSDKTVGRNGGDEDYDTVEFTAEDLVHDGFEVTSDAGRIADFMRRPGRQVIFSTYQSSHLIEEAQQDDAVPAFDLAFADEAHRCAGKRDSDFAIILDDVRIRASRRLFATATPKIQRTKNNEVENVADMSDEATFGKVFHRLTLGGAIRQGILSDYRVFVTQVDDPSLHRELNASDESLKVQKRHSVQVSMLKTIREYGLQRVVTFHNRVEDAKLYAAELPQVARAVARGAQPAVMPETVDYVSGKMSAEVRKQKLDVFRGNGDETCHVLSNARCLSEGVDVPAIDGVVFVDPRSSEIEIVQALGRAIRQHGAKEYGAIVVPVFVGKGQSPADAIEKSSFKHVVDVLNALRAHDMEFGAALDGMRQRQANGSAAGGEIDPFSKIKFDLRDAPILEQALTPILLESVTTNWEVGYACVKAFRETHNRFPKVKEAWKLSNGEVFPAGRWLDKQRHSQRAGRLHSRAVERLESLGVIWDVNQARWMEMYACAEEYFKKNGDLNVHWKLVWPEDDPNGEGLGHWITMQRQMYCGSQSEGLRLSDEKIHLLEKIGMVWAPKNDKWEVGFRVAKDYFDATGSMSVPHDLKLNGYPLYEWVNSQKQKTGKNKKRGVLSVAQMSRLKDIGINVVTDPVYIASCLQNGKLTTDLPERMAQHGCDLEESRALIEAGHFDDALRLLEEATGEELRMECRP